MTLEALIETAHDVHPEMVRGRIAVVIDVLRACSTIVAALAAGARKVIPVATIEEALIWPDIEPVVLAGERGGLPPPGFDLGNSPLEFTPELVAGRTVVITTTNGTLAIDRCKRAEAVILAAFVNMSAVKRWLSARREPAVIVCGGRQGEICEDDMLCAGTLAHELGGKGPGLVAARAMAADAPDIPTALRTTVHGKNLSRLGFASDVEWCAQRDTHDIVPVRTPDGHLVAEKVNIRATS